MVIDNEIARVTLSEIGELIKIPTPISKLKIGDVVISKHSNKLFMVYSEPFLMGDDPEIYTVNCTPIGDSL